MTTNNIILNSVSFSFFFFVFSLIFMVSRYMLGLPPADSLTVDTTDRHFLFVFFSLLLFVALQMRQFFFFYLCISFSFSSGENRQKFDSIHNSHTYTQGETVNDWPFIGWNILDIYLFIYVTSQIIHVSHMRYAVCVH